MPRFVKIETPIMCTDQDKKILNKIGVSILKKNLPSKKTGFKLYVVYGKKK